MSNEFQHPAAVVRGQSDIRTAAQAITAAVQEADSGELHKWNKAREAGAKLRQQKKLLGWGNWVKAIEAAKQDRRRVAELIRVFERYDDIICHHEFCPTLSIKEGLALVKEDHNDSDEPGPTANSAQPSQADQMGGQPPICNRSKPDREGGKENARANTASTPAPTDIPELVKPAFETRQGVVEWCGKLRAMREEINALSKRKGGQRLPVNQCEAAFADLEQKALANAPEHVCPDCNGKKTQCALCNGKGWVTGADFRGDIGPSLLKPDAPWTVR
jgi:hypothetical protein